MTQMKAAASTPTEDEKAGQRHLAKLSVAGALMAAIGAMLAGTGVGALTFNGLISRQLKNALNGHTLTSAGVLLQKRKARTAVPQQAKKSIGKDPREASPNTSSATSA
jgi:hypothetical protein